MTEYKCGEMHMLITPKGPDPKELINEIEKQAFGSRVNRKLLDPRLGLVDT